MNQKKVTQGTKPDRRPDGSLRPDPTVDRLGYNAPPAHCIEKPIAPPPPQPTRGNR